MSQALGAPRQVGLIADALRKRFRDRIDISDFTNPDPDERRRCLLSRAVAAAIAAARSDCDDDRAAAMVTDGGQDFGIDAVAFAAGPRLWLIQAKWNDKGAASFREQDVLVMGDGLRKIDHQELGRFNDRFQSVADQIGTLVRDPRARITLAIGLMRQVPLHEAVLQRLNELCDEYNAHGNYLDFEILYINEIWDLVRKSAQPEPIRLDFDVERWYDVTTPMRAVEGVTTAATVASWYEEHGDQLFQRNIRESLGVTQVNAEIARSLREEPYEFWYRNNGVRILCDSLSITPRSRSAPHGTASIRATNVSVVNGAQTVAAVAAAVKHGGDSVSEALVGVRVIESTDTATSDQITKATNTQNHIERRDFVALDAVQLAIKEEFSLTLGLTYAIRRSEFEPSPESGCTVREAALALACAHADPSLSQRVRNNEDLLWEEGPQGAYARIFSERPPAIQIWRSVLLLRKVRDSLHAMQSEVEGRAAAVAEQGSLIIAHIVFQEVGRDGIDDADFDWNSVLEGVPELVKKVFWLLVTQIDVAFGKTSFIGPTLSSPDRVSQLVRLVQTTAESGGGVPDPPREYRRIPQQRAGRRRNSVHILVDSGRIKDGSVLQFRPGREAELVALDEWLIEDSRRAVATWVNDRAKPLVWAADGKRYTPTGLIKRMWALAEWMDAPVAVAGPNQWYLGGEGSLSALAEAVLRETEGAEEESVP